MRRVEARLNMASSPIGDSPQVVDGVDSVLSCHVVPETRTIRFADSIMRMELEHHSYRKTTLAYLYAFNIAD